MIMPQWQPRRCLPSEVLADAVFAAFEEKFYIIVPTSQSAFVAAADGGRPARNLVVTPWRKTPAQALTAQTTTKGFIRSETRVPYSTTRVRELSDFPQ
jgi:hypothetical protein